MKILAIFIILLLLISCEKEISIDLDKHESKLVVNGFFSPSDNMIINISKSIPVLEKDSINYVQNAVVQLYCQNELAGTMNYLGNGQYSLNAPIDKEKVYKLVVDAPGLNTVNASSEIPLQPRIYSLDTTSIDDEFLYCELMFQNDFQSTNYYLLEIESEYPIINEDSIFSKHVEIINSDIIVENGQLGAKLERIVFSTEMLNDSVYTLGFALEKKELFITDDNKTNTLFIHFKKISEEYYQYTKSYYASKSKRDEIYSNIENGYGIFAGYNLTTYSIIISK